MPEGETSPELQAARELALNKFRKIQQVVSRDARSFGTHGEILHSWNPPTEESGAQQQAAEKECKRLVITKEELNKIVVEVSNEVSDEMRREYREKNQ